MNASSKKKRVDRLILGGLIVLSIVPLIGGFVRVNQLAGGAQVTAENARFFASPLPVLAHIFCAVIYSVLGAFQFAPDFRRRHRKWHRMAGRILIPCGLVVALSGLWMTQFYPSVNHDGVSVYLMRLVTGAAMAVFICLGVTAIMRRDFANHRIWMMRSFAIGLGAGTQVFTHIPIFIFPGIEGELARGLAMGAGWAINIAVAEWFIARERRRRNVAKLFATGGREDAVGDVIVTDDPVGAKQTSTS